jgi:hypothetical protein
VAAVAPGSSAGRELGKRGEAPAVGRVEGTGIGMDRVAAERDIVSAATSWGRGLGKLGAAGRTEGKDGLLGRAEGKDGVTGRAEGKDGVAGRAEGKDGIAGDGVVPVGVAAPTPTPKAGKAEPGPRVEGPASRPKPDAAIDSAGSRNTKP